MTDQRRKKEDDRRVIERVSSPHMRLQYEHMRWLLLFLTLVFGGIAIFNLISVSTVTEFTHGALTAVIFVILSVLMFRYYNAVLLFLANESSSNLDRTLERQATCWIAISFFVVIYITKYFVTKL